MDTVHSISASRRKGGGAEIVLESGERLTISVSRLAGFGVARGDDLDDEAVATLRHASMLDGVERRLIRLVAVRARSRAELARLLEGWAVPTGDRAMLLDRLAHAGLLDDETFARELSGGLRRRGQGSLRAAHEMARLGVDDAPATAALADHAQADGQIAAALLERRFGAPPYDDATARRAIGLLARRGFGEDLISSLLSLDDR